MKVYFGDKELIVEYNFNDRHCEHRIKSIEDLQFLYDREVDSGKITQVINSLREHLPNVYAQLAEQVKTNDSVLISRYIRGVLHYCDYCGAPTHNKVYCSKECADKDPKKQERQQQTNLERYGSKFNAQRPEALKKRSQTLLEKYGNPKYVNLEKRAETIRSKYGVDNITQTEMFKEKSKLTCLERYGVERYAESEEFKERFKKLWRELYGSKEQIQRLTTQRRATFLKNRGLLHEQWMSEHYNETIANLTKIYGDGATLIYSFGTNFKNIDDEYLERIKTCFNKEYIESHFIDDQGCFEFEEFKRFFKVSDSFTYHTKERLGINAPNQRHLCAAQFDFANQIDVKTKIINKRSTIKPYELDLYLPDFQLAVENNGIMYHSIGPSDCLRFRNFNDWYYHRRKYELCREKGIALFNVFEFDNVDFWVNLIHDYIGKINIIPRGEIKVVFLNEANQFIQTNSVFEPVKEQNVQCYGLIDNEDLQQLVVVKNKTIIRMVTKIGLSNDYNQLVEYVLGLFGEIFYINDDRIADSFVRRLNTTVVKQIDPTCKYFKKYSHHITYCKRKLTEQYRALYNAGYTLYKLRSKNNE